MIKFKLSFKKLSIQFWFDFFTCMDQSNGSLESEILLSPGMFELEGT